MPEYGDDLMLDYSKFQHNKTHPRKLSFLIFSPVYPLFVWGQRKLYLYKYVYVLLIKINIQILHILVILLINKSLIILDMIIMIRWYQKITQIMIII